MADPLTPEEVEVMERGAKNVLANPSDVSYLAYHYATLIVALAADWKRQREQIAALQTKTPPPA